MVEEGYKAVQETIYSSGCSRHSRVHILTRMFKVKAPLNTLLEWLLEAWR